MERSAIRHRVAVEGSGIGRHGMARDGTARRAAAQLRDGRGLEHEELNAQQVAVVAVAATAQRRRGARTRVGVEEQFASEGTCDTKSGLGAVVAIVVAPDGQANERSLERQRHTGSLGRQ
jgi:hypothetical protein